MLKNMEENAFINKVVYTTIKNQQAVLLKFGLEGFKLVSVQRMDHKDKINFYDVALYFTKETNNGTLINQLKKECESPFQEKQIIFYEEP